MIEEQKVSGMLSPYRVLDLTNERGFICGKVLADLGADVIKIERPGGDKARNIGPFYHDIAEPEKSLYWWAYNSSKKSITLNIETAQGQGLLKRLVQQADVVIESFDPGYLAKLGLDYSVLKQINPGIIMTSITGFGQEGPYKHYKAPDLVLWALSGNQYLYGDVDRPPLAPSFPISHFFGALQGAIGTMVALFHRSTTGEGQYIDASTQLSLIWATGPEYQGLWEFEKILLHRSGPNWLHAITNISIPVIYSCKDATITFFPFFGPPRIKANQALADWMESSGIDSRGFGQIDYSKIEWHNLTENQISQWTQGFAEFFKTKTTKEIMEGAAKRDIILYPIFTPRDMVEFPQLASREFWVKTDHPELNDTITYPGAFFKTTGPKCMTGKHPPAIGMHNTQVYINELGLSENELKNMQHLGIV